VLEQKAQEHSAFPGSDVGVARRLQGLDEDFLHPLPVIARNRDHVRKADVLVRQG
jgi:hypothetical protein